MKEDKYLFIVMSYGHELYRKSFNEDDYDKARRFYNYEYYRTESACIVYVDGEEMKFFDAFNYFKLSDFINQSLYLLKLDKESSLWLN